MLAAENGALPGGKVGGMGDVMRDVPRALAELGHRVTVLTPGYDLFSHLSTASHSGAVLAPYRGAAESLDLFMLPPSGSGGRLQQYIIEHPLFAVGGRGRIYCDDPPQRPFATDADKFALYCAGAAQALLEGKLGAQDVVHLHDWHGATFATLVNYHPRFAALASKPLVFTIHNLGMQGIRPLRGDASSLEAWFPQLAVNPRLLDPRYPDCYNPMRAAIQLCEQVHAVSPTYAREICDPLTGKGEGLQADLAAARDQGRLHGILNGCEYPDDMPEPLSFTAFLELARDELLRWIGAERLVHSAHIVALRRVERWLRDGREAPKRMLTAVGRLTDQKLGLFAQFVGGETLLDQTLALLGDDELLVVLGNGQPGMEQLFSAAHAVDERLLFLCGFSESLSDQLYAAGDLFLMPSRFEPCGIAQMLAMRAGQPCLVNRTGGLADTVIDNVNGFVFEGESDAARAEAMYDRLREALDRLRHHKRKSAAMRQAALDARFPWEQVAREYIEKLYPAV
jgi:starch synthase